MFRIYSYFSLAVLVLSFFAANPINSIASEAVTSEPLPIDYFVKKGDYIDIKISPDGEHFAARVRENDAVYLIFIRLSDGDIVGGVKPGANNEVSGVTWVSNRRVIYTFAEKHYYVDGAVHTGELFATDIDNKKNKLLAGYRASDAKLGKRIKSRDDSYATHKVLNVLPNDDRNVLIAEYPWTKSGRSWYGRGEEKPIVSKLDIYTGRKTEKELMPYDGAYPLANDAGDVNFISWDDDYINGNSAIRFGKNEPWVNTSSVLGKGNKNFVASRINRSGTKVYLSSYVDESRHETLHEFDLTTKKIKRVFDNEHPLVYSSYDTNGEPFVGMSYPDKQHYDYTLTNPNSSFVKTHKMLVKAFGGQEIQIRSKSLDGTKLIVRVDSGVNPGEYYLFNTVTKKADFIFANSSWIDPRKMLSKEPISLSARDGQQLHGYITMPANHKDKAPLLVLPHGGPHGVRDYHSFEPEVQMFANQGYAVLQINFRGSGGYGKTFEKLGYKQWGKSMVNDVIDATKWAIKSGYADAQRVCIYGASYGGYSALMSSVQAPDLYKCTVGYVGVYDLQAMKSKGDIPLGFRGKSYLDAVLGNDEADLIEQSPVNHAGKIKAAVMLIHGDEDIRVPSIHAKKMRKALKKSGNPAEWLYLGDVGHGARSEKNLKRVYGGILSFLEKHIGTSKSEQ